jgi:hypothetical protein
MMVIVDGTILSDPVYAIPASEEHQQLLGRLMVVWGQIEQDTYRILWKLLRADLNEYRARYANATMETKLSQICCELELPQNVVHRPLLLGMHEAISVCLDDRNTIQHGHWAWHYSLEDNTYKVGCTSPARNEPFWSSDLVSLHERMIEASLRSDAALNLLVFEEPAPDTRNRKRIVAPKAALDENGAPRMGPLPDTNGKFVPLAINREFRFLDDDKIATDDLDLARDIHSRLRSIVSYGDEFGQAVHLFDFARAQSLTLNDQMNTAANIAPDQSRENLFEAMERRQALRAELDPRERVFGGWKFIAARQGAISLFNLGMAMQKIRADLKSCPSLNLIVKQERLVGALQKYRGRFPRFEGVRHVVAHDAEFFAPQDERFKHALREPIKRGSFIEAGAGLPLGQNLNGDEFLCSFEGKLVSYQINAESFEYVKTAIMAMIDAFDDAMIA